MHARTTAARLKAAVLPASEALRTVPAEAIPAFQSRLALMLAITGQKAFGDAMEFTGRPNNISAFSASPFSGACRLLKRLQLLGQVAPGGGG
jgi:hypothetical protein